MTILPARHPECGVQRSVAELAAEAMYREITLTPKPGLVDRDNSGAHQDMNFTVFMASIAAVAPWFSLFFNVGKETASLGECKRCGQSGRRDWRVNRRCLQLQAE